MSDRVKSLIKADKFLHCLAVCMVGGIDKPNLPFGDRSWQRESDKRSFRELFFHKAPDDTGDADADFCKIDEQIHI